MYKATSRQVSMWEARTWLPEGAGERLSRSWAEGFQQHVLPLLLEAEDQFAGLYGTEGRPNWSVARALGCCLLQELHDLPDQAALDCLSFDLRWQHALGIESSDAYLSRRGLVGFRSRLVAQDPELGLVRELFDRICATALSKLNISTTEQRLDSTLVVSNIRVRGRVGLFRKTLEHFLDELATTSPEQYARLNPELRAWHSEDNEPWGQHATQKEQRAKLVQMAQWTYEVLQTFDSDKLISSGGRYRLLARLFSEQCEVVEGESGEGDEGDEGDAAVTGPLVQVVTKFVNPGTNMRSPFDPDAGTGHKGVGYNVHVTETCRNDETPEIITDYEVVSAGHSDIGRATGAIERLDAAELRPEVLYADAGYPTPQSLEEAKSAGVELFVPVHRGRMSAEIMSRQDFARDPETGDVVSCPQGHAPTRHDSRHIAPGRFSKHAFFARENCRSCPSLAKCPVRGPNHKRNREFRLDVSEGLQIRDEIFVKQTQPEWQKRYRIRSGVEATMSELKRAHGIGTLRVRTMPRVSLAVGMKVMACNIKRWLRGMAASTTPAAA